jgi:2-polyprenyl-6-methoxyphenol hydroxylase-like FAD-dependent oxidoreductase
MAATKIAVVGAGIGGLAAALALLRRGLDVTVYEQSAELKEVGAGVQISSNGSRVLFALGLAEALARVQVMPSRRVIRHWSTGETWDWFALGAATAQRYGSPHLMLHRGDLHGILAAAVRAHKADAIRLAKRCVAVTPTASTPRCAPTSLAPTVRGSPAASPGAGWWRWTSCRRIWRRCSAPTGSARAATCCTIRCGAAS